MTRLLDPRAEEYRRLDGAEPLKPVEAVELNVGILNSRWESMTRIAALVDERLRRLSFIRDVRHWKIKHSEPTPQEVIDQVVGYSHFAVLGLGN